MVEAANSGIDFKLIRVQKINDDSPPGSTDREDLRKSNDKYYRYGADKQSHMIPSDTVFSSVDTIPRLSLEGWTKVAKGFEDLGFPPASTKAHNQMFVMLTKFLRDADPSSTLEVVGVVACWDNSGILYHFTELEVSAFGNTERIVSGYKKGASAGTGLRDLRAPGMKKLVGSDLRDQQAVESWFRPLLDDKTKAAQQAADQAQKKVSKNPADMLPGDLIREPYLLRVGMLVYLGQHRIQIIQTSDETGESTTNQGTYHVYIKQIMIDDDRYRNSDGGYLGVIAEPELPSRLSKRYPEYISQDKIGEVLDWLRSKDTLESWSIRCPDWSPSDTDTTKFKFL